MPTILQITVDGNAGSTGRIAEAIGRLAIDRGWDSYIAYGRVARPSKSHIIKIGSPVDVYMHGLQTRLFDRHGLGSRKATLKLVDQIKGIKPDIIHLHNLHGYYINIEVLFNYFASVSTPVLWTFHDCWSFTGHCSHFENIGCEKWKTACHHCPQKREYPASYLIDRSRKNYQQKKELFKSVPNLTVISVSNWLDGLVHESFLGNFPSQVIYNGIDINVFTPHADRKKVKEKLNIGDGFMLLGVAGVWPRQKGLDDFIKLSQLIGKTDFIVLVGLDKSQMKGLPTNIIGISRTENRKELSDLYATADVYVNPTLADSFPTTNIEALACGTPVITYKTGGSPEAIDTDTGIVVDVSDLYGLFNAVEMIREKGKSHYSAACRARALKYFDKNEQFQEYIDLYEKTLTIHAMSNVEPNFEKEKLRSLEDEKLRSLEDERMRSLEDERLRSLEDERMRGLEDERMRGLEDEKMRSLEDEKLRSLEDEKLRSLEGERLRSLEEENLLTSGPVNHLTSKPLSLLTSNYQICTNCIMDTSDPRITFDEKGQCDYCRNYYKNILPNWNPDERGYKELMKIAAKIKKEGEGKDFDCIIGLSGGPDSSYTVYVAKEIMGLRPLVFHVDAGWNTRQAVSNIEKLLDGLGLDLYTEVIDWEEMKDLQVAYFKSQIANMDDPQDTAFFSGMYRFARKNKIKYILTGANYSTECCREPEEWGAYPGIDRRLIHDIHNRFGKIPLKTFPIVDVFTYKIFYKYFLGMQVIKPLNYVPYLKNEAEKLMETRFGWEKMQHKHHESRFTRFYEDYWMPRKFGYEKRRAHFSGLIMTGQMTREEALQRIAKPEMSEEFLKQEFEYVANKLGLTVEELQNLFKGENKTYHNYRNKRKLIGLGARTMTLLGLENRLFR